jgi:hypothetical protein
VSSSKGGVLCFGELNLPCCQEMRLGNFVNGIAIVLRNDVRAIFDLLKLLLLLRDGAGENERKINS